MTASKTSGLSGHLTGRALWRVGDWGNASEHIGRRWEHVGAEMVRARLGRPLDSGRTDGFIPAAMVCLVEIPGIVAAIQSEGLTHADAILVGRGQDGPVCLPVDFKWSIETATPRQVDAEVLQTLLQSGVAGLQQAVEDALASAGLAGQGPIRVLDGLFISPDTSANRFFMARSRHRAQEETVLPDQVQLLAVDGRAFFSPLRGWEMGVELARMEGAMASLSTVEGAERYYRLGAGVMGALEKLSRSVFSDQTSHTDSVAALRELRRTRGLRTLSDVLAYLDRAMATRRQRQQFLANLAKSAYPFSQFRQDLADFVASSADLQDRSSVNAWGPVYGEVMKYLDREITSRGKELMRQGKTEAQALAELAKAAGDLSTMARARARQLIAVRFASVRRRQ